MAIPISRLLVLKERLQSDDDALVKKTLKELDRAEMTFDLLKETGIGVSVNKLRHHDHLGATARHLVSKWKESAAVSFKDNGSSNSSSSSSTGHHHQKHQQNHNNTNSSSTSSSSSSTSITSKSPGGKIALLNAATSSSSKVTTTANSSSSSSSRKSKIVTVSSPILPLSSSSASEEEEEEAEEDEEEEEEQHQQRSKKRKVAADPVLMDEDGKFTADCGSFEQILGLNDSSSSLSVATGNAAITSSCSSKKHRQQQQNAYSSSPAGKRSEFTKMKSSSMLAVEDNDRRNGMKVSKSATKTSDNSSKSTNHQERGGINKKRKRNLADSDDEEEDEREDYLPHSTSSSLPSLDWSKVLPDKLATDYRPQANRSLLLDFEDDQQPRRGGAGIDNNSMDEVDFAEMKNRRLTKVYSGRRKANAGALQEAPRLDECCIRVLRDNVEVLKYANTTPPFHLITRVLERATPSQLYEIEDRNPRLLEDTSDLWQAHCERDFKSAEPDWEEGETWRELYERMLAERDKKFNKLKRAIAEQKAASESAVRQAKMAMAIAPREVRRRQMRYGTYKKEALLPDTQEILQARKNLDLLPPGHRPAASAAGGAGARRNMFSHVYETEQRQKEQPKNRKPAVAPLMAKSLKMMKKNRAR